MNNLNKPIYLDYAATTPVDPKVVQCMMSYLSQEGHFGNPASQHEYGKAALQAIEEARSSVAALLSTVPRNIIFTSGATEANNLALKGAALFYQRLGNHIVTSETEHRAVLDPCQHLAQQGFEVTYLKPDRQGLIKLEDIESALKQETRLVSIMHVNNETGIIQDIEAIGEMTRKKGILFHVDASQSVGKIPLDLQKLKVDLLSFSAHKMYGPKGIGALYIGDRPLVKLVPQCHGGSQERKLRAGTLPTHQIVGLGEACKMAKEALDCEAQLAMTGEALAMTGSLRARLWEGIKDLPGVHLNGHFDASKHAAHILNICFAKIEKERLLEVFKGLAISNASACNAITLESSHVLRAMGLSDLDAERSFRFSFGKFTTEEEIDTVIQIIRGLV